MKPSLFYLVLPIFVGVATQNIYGAAARNPAPPPPDLSNYILTPPAPHTPRINGPSIYGERPGNPFLYSIPATGDRPMTFAADGLPAGLKLDPNTGQITGAVATAGTYPVALTAENALGKAMRNFKIVIGDLIALTPPMGWIK
jgi:alpha-galactosidase